MLKYDTGRLTERGFGVVAGPRGVAFRRRDVSIVGDGLGPGTACHPWMRRGGGRGHRVRLGQAGTWSLDDAWRLAPHPVTPPRRHPLPQCMVGLTAKSTTTTLRSTSTARRLTSLPACERGRRVWVWDDLGSWADAPGPARLWGFRRSSTGAVAGRRAPVGESGDPARRCMPACLLLLEIGQTGPSPFHRNPGDIDWGKSGADYICESTGVFTDVAKVWAARVLATRAARLFPFHPSPPASMLGCAGGRTPACGIVQRGKAP